ncbi:MAG: SIMPL domain-containing protein [Clostridia bacterium]|nr:SIMPL domain-containing protein [Clostridia bacterium]
MKKLFALILALLMLCLPALSLAEAAQGATITVTGTAAVTLKADYAQVTVGVRTNAKTVEAATEENGTAIRAVIAALIEAGVAEEDIATSNYSVSAEYDYSSFTSDQRLTGYNVTNQLTVILRDMTCIGAVLDKATAAGANSIYNIEFLSTQSAAAQDEAAVYAVQEAMRKADLLAKAAGLEVGAVISMEESTSGWYSTARTYNLAETAKTSNVILPDEASISASVTMVFELK